MTFLKCPKCGNNISITANSAKSTNVSPSNKMDHLIEERNHIENLLNTRFNFFLLIFASIIASFTAVENLNQLKLILISGTIIESLFAIVIGRAQLKLSLYLHEIRKNENESETTINNKANSSNNILINGSRNIIIGYLLPALISVLLILSAIFSELIYNTFICN